MVFDELLPDDDKSCGVTNEVGSDEYYEETEETMQFDSEHIMQTLNPESIRDTWNKGVHFALFSLEKLNGFNTPPFNICGKGEASFIFILVNNLTEHENRMLFYDLEVI